MKKNISNYNRQVEKSKLPKKEIKKVEMHRCTIDFDTNIFNELSKIALQSQYQGRYQRVIRKLFAVALKNQDVLKELNS